MQIACLGVRDVDWQALASAVVQTLQQPDAVGGALGCEDLSNAAMQEVIRRLSQQGEAGLPHAIALADAMAALVSTTSPCEPALPKYGYHKLKSRACKQYSASVTGAPLRCEAGQAWRSSRGVLRGRGAREGCANVCRTWAGCQRERTGLTAGA